MPFLIHSEQLFERAFSRIFRRANLLKIGKERLHTLVKQIKKSNNHFGVLSKLHERLKLKMVIFSDFLQFLEHFWFSELLEKYLKMCISKSCKISLKPVWLSDERKNVFSAKHRLLLWKHNNCTPKS